MGWVSKKDVALPSAYTLSTQGVSGAGASSEEVELAARGFSEDVEKQHRATSPEAIKQAYQEVEFIQAATADLVRVAEFARIGRVGGK